MLFINSFTFNPFEENTFVLYDETNECIIIDPGCSDESERKLLTSFIDEQQLKVKLLVNTHCHIDHVLGNEFVKELYQVDLVIHQAEKPVLKAVEVYAASYGFPQYRDLPPDRFVADGDHITFGNQSLDVLFVPGHSPGHIAFYDARSGILIGGDVLFYNSIGRTDMPGGNYDLLIDSIRTKFFNLPDAVKVYPGHGPETTIGFEKKTNPFCAVDRDVRIQ